MLLLILKQIHGKRALIAACGMGSHVTHKQAKFVDYIHSPTLISLDLSSNYDLVLDTIMFNKLVQILPNLREVDLSFVNMSLVEPVSLMNLSSSLSSLQLFDCGLQGEFPANLLQGQPSSAQFREKL
ncbi:hypothetical protein GH714_011409 [Hevea brasiliensis]|uniref:Leucine-rich repeat-containing N-terminal plant-type domain-containing protein n=1 Tax=Hevea brasiliensis TaxID=3981 RepID=A0A6A6N3Z8_HEVBR|nr:hypothetical protein GH714_011409 [Hevea brasiliensis]